MDSPSPTELVDIAMGAFNSHSSSQSIEPDEAQRRVQRWANHVATTREYSTTVTSEVLAGVPRPARAVNAVHFWLLRGSTERAATLLGTFLASGTIEGDEKIRRRLLLTAFGISFLLLIVTAALTLTIWSVVCGVPCQPT